jgi:hypothetical protein
MHHLDKTLDMKFGPLRRGVAWLLIPSTRGLCRHSWTLNPGFGNRFNVIDYLMKYLCCSCILLAIFDIWLTTSCRLSGAEPLVQKVSPSSDFVLRWMFVHQAKLSHHSFPMYMHCVVQTGDQILRRGLPDLSSIGRGGLWYHSWSSRK